LLRTDVLGVKEVRPQSWPGYLLFEYITL